MIKTTLKQFFVMSGMEIEHTISLKVTNLIKPYASLVIYALFTNMIFTVFIILTNTRPTENKNNFFY